MNGVLTTCFTGKKITEPREQHGHPVIGRSTGVHNIWQVDAKEQCTLLDGSRACYLTFTDEYSGAWLCAKAFPYAYISQVPLAEVQSALSTVFTRWGKAGAFRVDNGAPLGNPKMSSTPTLALWLIANDVDVIWNKPRSPQKNPKVERMQGTSSRWVNIESCANLTELQKRLDEEALVQREKYPVKRLADKTRLDTFPQLSTIPRPFNASDFDPQRAYQFLAKKTYIRTTDRAGCLMIYSVTYNLSAKNKKQTISIKFLPLSQEWCFYLDDKIIATKKAENLNPDRIRYLTVCQGTSQ